jgi:hypothetical protein
MFFLDFNALLVHWEHLGYRLAPMTLVVAWLTTEVPQLANWGYPMVIKHG